MSVAARASAEVVSYAVDHDHDNVDDNDSNNDDARSDAINGCDDASSCLDLSSSYRDSEEASVVCNGAAPPQFAGQSTTKQTSPAPRPVDQSENRTAAVAEPVRASSNVFRPDSVRDDAHVDLSYHS